MSFAEYFDCCRQPVVGKGPSRSPTITAESETTEIKPQGFIRLFFEELWRHKSNLCIAALFVAGGCSAVFLGPIGVAGVALILLTILGILIMAAGGALIGGAIGSSLNFANTVIEQNQCSEMD